jgi:hypothetical protein
MKQNFWPGARCVFLVFLWLSFSQGVWAQAVGTIIGMVTDPNGAVVAGAKVTALNLATQAAQSTVTTGAGNFTIPNLGVATYDVTVDARVSLQVILPVLLSM